MKAFFTLCRIEIIALLSAMNLRGRKREKAFAAPVAALLAGGLMAYIGVAYALPMALTLIPMLMGDLYWGQMVLMAFILCLSLTVMAGSGMLFGGKDMDFLFALPLSARTVLAAKLLALYLENVFLTLCMLLPSGIVYAMQTVFSPCSPPPSAGWWALSAAPLPAAAATKTCWLRWVDWLPSCC